jgi:hypothetical protein
MFTGLRHKPRYMQYLWASGAPIFRPSGCSLGEDARPLMLLGNDGVRPVADLRQINLHVFRHANGDSCRSHRLLFPVGISHSCISHGHVDVLAGSNIEHCAWTRKVKEH